MAPAFAVDATPAFAINTAPPPAAPTEQSVLPVAGFDQGMAVASDFSSTASTTESTRPSAAKKSRPKKPIDLPFNLKLDPKFLEPKYVAGAAGGVIVLFTLLIWLFAGGGTKPAKVQATPVVKTPAASATPPPGMFNLPRSDSLPNSRPAATPYGTKPEFDEFGFQKQSTPAAPAPTRPRR
jgi:hypothetical protein